MNNREFAKQLEKRTKQFAIGVFHLSSKLPNSPEGRVIKHQVCKSGSSVGANYREANRTRSLADFRSKISICESEASETLYWIEIVMESGLFNSDHWIRLHQEANEILAIFTSIGKNTKT